jgi:hypothetical protein
MVVTGLPSCMAHVAQPVSEFGLEDEAAGVPFRLTVPSVKAPAQPVVQLPGLTRGESALHERLVSELDEVDDASDPGDSNCTAGLGMGNGLGVLGVPVFAVAGLIAIGCGLGHAAASHAYETRRDLIAQLTALKARIRPESPYGCTTAERRKLLSARLKSRSPRSICDPPPPKPVAAVEDEEPSEPAPVENTAGAQWRERALGTRDAAEAEASFRRACGLGEAEACEEGAAASEHAGHLQLASQLRQFRSLLLLRTVDDPMPPMPWLEPQRSPARAR